MLYQVTGEDLGLARFALGRFIDYRLEEGFPDDESLLLFKQAYLNLDAILRGQEPRDVRELLSQAVADTPCHKLSHQWIQPIWLPRGEKLRLYHEWCKSDPNMTCHCE